MDYAQGLADLLDAAGVRVECDDRSEKLGFKIREAEVKKIPLMLVVGDQEQENGTVTPRWRHGEKGSDEAVTADALIAKLTDAIRERRVRVEG
jgi:threonyl-tRNA synthetase